MALITPGLRELRAAGLRISSRVSVAAARVFVGMLGSLRVVEERKPAEIDPL